MNKLRTIGSAILEHHGFFSLDQISRGTGISPSGPEALTGRWHKYVNDVLGIFCQEGLVKVIRKRKKEHRPGLSPTYSIIYRVADRKALAARVAPRLKENTIQDRLWFVIRKKRNFNLRDLMVLAGAVKGTARWYMKALRKIGVIQPLRKGGPGCEWTLLKDVGPHRPYVGGQKAESLRPMRASGPEGRRQ
jgi:hypothetical protein